MRKQPDDLTDAQWRVLMGLAKLMKRNPAPSLLEWADHDGISYSTLKQHAHELSKKRYILNTPGKSRTTRITVHGAKALGIK